MSPFTWVIFGSIFGVKLWLAYLDLFGLWWRKIVFGKVVEFKKMNAVAALSFLSRSHLDLFPFLVASTTKSELRLNR